MSDRDDQEFGRDPYAPDREGPNTDFGNQANPPDDVDMPRTSDDNDLNPEGGGFTDTPLRRPYEMMARRDELARQLEEIVVSVREWADEQGSDDARAIADDLEDVYERLGQPSEETDRTLGDPNIEGDETES